MASKRKSSPANTVPATIAAQRDRANTARARNKAIAVEQSKIRKAVKRGTDRVATKVATGKTITEDIRVKRDAVKLDATMIRTTRGALREIEDRVKRAAGAVDVAAGAVDVAAQREDILKLTTQRKRAEVAASVERERVGKLRTDLARAGHARAVNAAEVADAMAAIAALRASMGN